MSCLLYKNPYCIKLLLATVSVLSVPKSCKFSNSKECLLEGLFQSDPYACFSTQRQALCARCIGFILNMFQVFLPSFQDDLIDEVCVLL